MAKFTVHINRSARMETNNRKRAYSEALALSEKREESVLLINREHCDGRIRIHVTAPKSELFITEENDKSWIFVDATQEILDSGRYDVV